MEETVLRFTTQDVTIELQGSEDFVERGILKEEGVAAGGTTSKGSAS